MASTRNDPMGDIELATETRPASSTPGTSLARWTRRTGWIGIHYLGRH